MQCHGLPAILDDGTIAKQFEVLQTMPLRRRRVLERIGHADAVDRLLWHAVHGGPAMAGVEDDAVTLEQSVATPIEQQMNGIDGLDYITSESSADGTASVGTADALGSARAKR